MFIQSEKRGGQIVLRPYAEADIEKWQQWDTDPVIQRYMPEPPNEIQSYEDQFNYLEECRTDAEGVYATIADCTTGEGIGSVSLTDIDFYHGVAELGIVIGDSRYSGRGIASEAVKLILSQAKDLKLRRIIAEFESGNIPMQKVLEKNGFLMETVCVGSRIKNNEVVDTIRYYKML